MTSQWAPVNSQLTPTTSSTRPSTSRSLRFSCSRHRTVYQSTNCWSKSSTNYWPRARPKKRKSQKGKKSAFNTATNLRSSSNRYPSGNQRWKDSSRQRRQLKRPHWSWRRKHRKRVLLSMLRYPHTMTTPSFWKPRLPLGICRLKSRALLPKSTARGRNSPTREGSCRKLQKRQQSCSNTRIRCKPQCLPRTRSCSIFS